MLAKKYNMPNQIIEGGVVHDIPDDLKQMLSRNLLLLEKWNSLTTLARNEWICWVTIVKKEATRTEHINRLAEELLEGKRRPCCWPGCPHRNKNADKWFHKKSN